MRAAMITCHVYKPEKFQILFEEKYFLNLVNNVIVFLSTGGSSEALQAVFTMKNLCSYDYLLRL